MNYALPVGFGVSILVLLVYFVLRTRSTSYDAIDLDEFKDSLSNFRTGLVAESQMDRLFCAEDWEYVSRVMPPSIQKMFYRERRAVLILWLLRTRKSAGKLVRQYKKIVRDNPDLSGITEIKIGLDYYRFWLFCEFLLLLVWLRGPIKTAKMIRWTLGRARRFSFQVDQLSADSVS
jgi:hypothetical protein